MNTSSSAASPSAISARCLVSHSSLIESLLAGRFEAGFLSGWSTNLTNDRFHEFGLVPLELGPGRSCSARQRPCGPKVRTSGM